MSSAERDVSVWMCESISCRSNSTRESGVVRSMLGSEALLLASTRLLAWVYAEKSGDVRTEKLMYVDVVVVAPLAGVVLLAMVLWVGDENQLCDGMNIMCV